MCPSNGADKNGERRGADEEDEGCDHRHVEPQGLTVPPTVAERDAEAAEQPRPRQAENPARSGRPARTPEEPIEMSWHAPS